MAGFEKIEFTPIKKISRDVKDVSSKKPAQNTTIMAKKRKKLPVLLFVIPLIIIVLLALVGVLIAFPAIATYKSGLQTYREAKLIVAAAKNQNIDLVSDEIGKTKQDLLTTQKNLHRLAILHYIPLANWYYNDADHLLQAGSYGLDSGTIVADSLKPYADVLGLKGKGSFAMGSASDRIKTAVMTTGKITPKIDDIASSLALVQKEVDAVDPNHYPEFIFGKKVKAQLANLRTITDEGVTFINEARPLVKLLPSLLGDSEEKKYLVLFQNDKELRPSGGFITAYAIFRIDEGIIHLDRTDDIYTLDDSVPNKQKAPAPILKYFPGVYTFNLRDSNLSADFVESMKTFKAMYDTAGESVKVDGIIAIDTNVLVSTIKILDNHVEADGMTFTTDNDPHCNCPQVIYQLENSISRPVNYVKTERKGLIGDLLSTIMTKALSSSPKIYWGPLFQSIIAQTNQKHILFYLYDPDAQSGIEALNAAGRIRDFNGDYLSINEANFSGAKVNIFMQESVDSTYDIGGDGSITKTVTIHYKDPFPPSDCNLERGGLCLNAEYRDWFRIYVPKGSELLDSKGSQVKLTSYDDLGKTVFEGFITVRPQGIATFTVTYKLPFKISSGSPLPVLIQKQPGTDGNQYNMIVNGNTVDSFQLFSDKETTLKK